MTNRVNFALVGCGRISRKHITAIKRNLLDSAQLVAICDINKEKARKVGIDNELPYYYTYDEMLEKHPEIDVVNILTESGNHAIHAIDIVSKYKKHIVVEKPMALTISDADNMIKTCDKEGVKLFVVKQNRYNLPVLKLQEALKAGRFGKLVMGSVRIRWCRTQTYYDQASWRGTWAMDGGVFTNQASHHIDLLEWMLGEAESVFAKSRIALADIETEDTGVAVITFQNGAIGTVEATTATRPKDLEGSLSILGEKGSVVIEGFAINQIKTWEFENQLVEDKVVMEDYRENPPDIYGFGHIRYLKNVCDSLVNHTKALVDGLEGRKSLRLITAIYESIETGKEVYLQYSPMKCKLGIKNGK